jgi:hypothetical protein
VAIWDTEDVVSPSQRGVVVVGGLRACAMNGIVGAFCGSPVNATRDLAVPLIPLDILQRWAKSERDARVNEGRHPSYVLASCADIVLRLGIEPSKLPVAQTDTGWVTPEQVELLAKTMHEVLLVSPLTVENAGGVLAKAHLNSGTLTTTYHGTDILPTLDWPYLKDDELWGENAFWQRSRGGAVVKSLSRGWGCPIEEVLAASNLDADGDGIKREIGVIQDKPYVDLVDAIIRCPRAHSSTVKPRGRNVKE